MREKQYILFGCGKNFSSYYFRLKEFYKIAFYSDNSEASRKWYRNRYDLQEILPSEIKDLENPCVIITIDNEVAVHEIKKQFEKDNISCIHAQKMLSKNICLKPIEITWPQEVHGNKIYRFIDISVDQTTLCNFHCAYCYVWRQRGFEGNFLTSKGSVKEVRAGLSRERLGGVCFINLCARGETFLSKDIVELVYELLDEGHFVSVVTNGTVRKNIKKILEFPEELQERMFFKVSFHYHELLEKKLLDEFWQTIASIRNSKCSYTLEITPYDDLVKDIENIKAIFEEKECGAMPHISFARDIQKDSLEVLSNLSLEEYNNIWGQFDSKMFSLKREWYGEKIDKFCHAGNWSYRLNLSNGSIQNCYKHGSIGSIFDKESKGFPVVPIAHDCKMPYCYNNHAFLAWGCVPEISCFNYYDMRNRFRKDGTSWLTKKMSAAMSTKLEEEHFEYVNKWDDYEKLYNRTNKPAIILFNSPDYKNLGDHAIALAERQFFEQNFKEYDFIEISCEEYIKENQQIKSFIRNDDIVVITGGGNFGTLWLWIHDLTMNIIHTFMNNKIIILPQSLYFEETEFGKNELERAKQTLESHGQITLCLRDKCSMETANLLFGKNVKKLLVPDMVLNLKFKDLYDRHGVAICLRNDKEKLDIDSEYIFKVVRDMGEEVSIISTISKENIFLNNREDEIKKILKTIAKQKLVVTDRLHGMIFCAITQTPCIVFDNSYGKISGVYEWIKGLSYIKFCDSVSTFQEKMELVLNSQHDFKYELNNVEAEFLKFVQILKEEIR